MHPVLFKIGGFEIRTWGVLVLLGFLAGIWYAAKQAEKNNVSREYIYDLGFWIIIAAIIGARILFVIYHWELYRGNIGEIFAVWHGGMMFMGGLILAFPTAIYYIHKHRLPFWKLGDWTAPGLALGMFIGRWGCFFNGCCFGTACHLPWCVAFKPGSEAFAVFGATRIHPTELYESFGNLILFLFLILLKKKEPYDGFLLLLYFIFGPLIRFTDDFFRYYETKQIYGPFTVNQWIALAIAFTSLILMIIMFKKNAGTKSRSI